MQDRGFRNAMLTTKLENRIQRTCDDGECVDQTNRIDEKSRTYILSTLQPIKLGIVRCRLRQDTASIDKNNLRLQSVGL